MLVKNSLTDQKKQVYKKEKEKRQYQKQIKKLKIFLNRLPFQIFLLVADADGTIDSKEISLFNKILHHREDKCSNPYTRRIFHATFVNFKPLQEMYLAGKITKDIKEVEHTVTYIQQCVSKTKMTDIAQDLLNLATDVAKASGGFLGIGNAISKEEKAVISQLNKILKQAIEDASGPEEKENPIE